MTDYKLYERNKRANRLYNSKRAKSRLLRELKNSQYFKPSIYAKWKIGPNDEVLYTGEIRRGKNSNRQKWMKKASARKVRKLKDREIILRGNGHRKYWDYWWTWI